MSEISSDVIRGYNDTMILQIKETTLYSAFTRMEKNGYIESFVAEPDSSGNGKKRTYYRITDRGKEYYKTKCEEWEITKEVIQKFIRGE